jgi:ubiquinone/menaquinone biosynthesis C-methylase UbiE
MESKLTEQEARDKNMDEYNKTADAYDRWCQENILMQKYCYYSTFQEMEKEGIEGKTFLEVGCGPCPIGQILAKKGAKKIFGLDISSEMIESAKKNLTEMGIIDKFELVVADIFDQSFQLPEKVDCVVLSYTLTTFINNYEMLASILS